MSDSKPAGVIQVARLYTDIALFRRGPEDVPVSAVLLVLTIAVYVLLSLALSAVSRVADGNRIVLIALDSFFAIAWYWVVMRLAGRPERFLQTATAIFGFQTILAPAVIGRTWLVPPVHEGFHLAAAGRRCCCWPVDLDSGGRRRILRSATGWPHDTLRGACRPAGGDQPPHRAERLPG